ncbi:MAG TPA: hypothetical protein DIW50_09275 [Prolixibacteraceae bacterium]|nr:hypothetical protein [Prolixibacteraceae bacterium]
MGKGENVQKLNLQIEELKRQLAEAEARLTDLDLQRNNQQETEDALREMNRRMSTMINNLKGVVYRCRNNHGWTMEYISQGITDLTGYPADDFIDDKVRSFNSIIVPEDRTRLWEYWQSILAKKQYFTNEYRILTSSGEERWVWERGCGVFENDQLIALEGFLMDITERKKAETELKFKEELLHLTGSLAKVGGWEFDVQTLEGTWSDEVALIHDLDPSLPTNAELGISFYTPESKAMIEKAINEAIEKGIPYDLELELISAKGARKWIRTQGTPLFVSDKVVRMRGIFQDITERKEAIIKLEEEKSRLKALIETIPDLIWLKDTEGVYISCNPRFESFFGAKEAEIKGKTDYDFIPKELADFFRQKDKEAALANRPTTNFEWVTFNDDGHQEYLETIKTPMYDSQGKLIGVLGIARDITEKHRNEEMLKEKDLIFQSLLENSPVYIFFKDHNIKALHLSRNYEEMLGMPLDEIIGKDMNDLFPSDLAKSMVEDDRRILNEGRLVQVDEELNGKYYTTIKFPIAREGEAPWLAGFTIDITDRKMAEMALQQSEARLSAFMSFIPAMILIKDDQLRPVFANEKFHEVFPVEDWMGKKPHEIFQKDVADLMVSKDNQVLEKGHVSYEEVWNDRNGVSHIYQTQKFRIDIPESRPLLGAIITDITEWKNAQNELLLAKEKAEESDKLKTAFLQNMSHEIRTPMNAIMGFSEILPDSFDDKPQLEYYTGIISQRCTDLLGIIDEILDIARIESGHLSIHKEECNLNKWISEIDLFLREYQKRLKKEHILFSLKCDFPEDQIVIIDQGKIKQILINMVGNAFKFTEKGKIEIGCGIYGHNQLHFYFSDTGIGIPKEKQSFIFNRFAQADSMTSRLYGGTGLGLAIVKGLLDALHGSIHMESEPGKGTVFHFSVPFSKCQKKEKRLGLSDHIPTSEEHVRKKILIVEDDHYNFVYLKQLFRGTDHIIIHAENGKKALDQALNNDFDLVLMDIRLPDIDGYEITRKIKEQKPKLKIIAQTAYASENDKQNALNAGCDDYISKPIQNDLFMQKVNNLLKMS